MPLRQILFANIGISKLFIVVTLFLYLLQKLVATNIKYANLFATNSKQMIDFVYLLRS